MTTPSPKYFCPRCRAVYDTDMNYCGRCGADMHRASRLQYALKHDEDSSTRLPRPDSDADPDAGESSDEVASRPRRETDFRDEWLGQIVDNRYRVVDVVGRGGMGVVYKVEHQRMGKIAAMKVLHGDLANDREVIRRFHREAEAVSRLNHPNTVQVFDFGMTKAALYLVMEYVRGLDIGALIDRDGPMEFARAAPLFGQICSALAEAHELGVVHRDLKPENILVTRTHGGQDFVKVLDFGLAKLSEREELAEVTGRGSIVGTPYYMSPEQIRGEAIDHRADIYSMGALMYRVLTSEHCFTAKTPVGVLTKHLTEPVLPPSTRRPDLELDPRIDDMILRAMQKRPEDRYPSVRELLGEIEARFSELGGEGSSARARLAWGLSGSGPAHTPRRLVERVDYGIDSGLRLRRADLDRFERSLKRRRRLRVVALPLMLCALGGAGYAWFVVQGRGVKDSEREPNDDIDAATLIGSNRAVTAKLGRRISRTEPDRDFFRVAGRPRGESGGTITARVTGLPNLDIDLYLYSADGKLLARANEGGVGAEEWIRRHRVVKPAALLVTVA
jgi:serine/threonine-protein kinase